MPKARSSTSLCIQCKHFYCTKTRWSNQQAQMCHSYTSPHTADRLPEKLKYTQWFNVPNHNDLAISLQSHITAAHSLLPVERILLIYNNKLPEKPKRETTSFSPFLPHAQSRGGALVDRKPPTASTRSTTNEPAGNRENPPWGNLVADPYQPTRFPTVSSTEKQNEDGRGSVDPFRALGQKQARMIAVPEHLSARFYLSKYVRRSRHHHKRTISQSRFAITRPPPT